jgi:hypothetical protein
VIFKNLSCWCFGAFSGVDSINLLIYFFPMCFNAETSVQILCNDKLTKATFEHVVKVNVIYFKVQQVT